MVDVDVPLATILVGLAATVTVDGVPGVKPKLIHPWLVLPVTVIVAVPRLSLVRVAVATPPG